jgi:hypothetical protein
MRAKCDVLGGRWLTLFGCQEKWIKDVDELRVFVEYREGELGKCLDNARNDLGVGELGALVPCRDDLALGVDDEADTDPPREGGPSPQEPFRITAAVHAELLAYLVPNALRRQSSAYPTHAHSNGGCRCGVAYVNCAFGGDTRDGCVGGDGASSGGGGGRLDSTKELPIALRLHD